MRDFDSWYIYISGHLGQIDREIAIKLYNEFYSCTCVSCEYRKEHGLMPVNQGINCTIPLNLSVLEQAVVATPKRDQNDV